MGFDVDLCRAIAAAVLGDANAIRIVPTTPVNRFLALQSGEVDVLIRNTTWTFGRDVRLGINFAPPVFYDGQGIMAPLSEGIRTLADLTGRTICVSPGTTSAKNLPDVMTAEGIDYEQVLLDTSVDFKTAYESGLCDAYSNDKSFLSAQKTLLSKPDEHIILLETLSKEPLAPAVRQGDEQWFDIVKWVMFGLFAAEEHGVTSENVTEVASSTKIANVLYLLGLEGDYGQELGLESDFMFAVITQVGNYGQIYERNLGADSSVNLPRGQNAQYTDGGLIYAPPFR